MGLLSLVVATVATSAFEPWGKPRRSTSDCTFLKQDDVHCFAPKSPIARWKNGVVDW
jgi:hypothetical protein